MATDSNGNIILTTAEPVTIPLATNDSVIDNFSDRSIIEFTTSKRPLSNVEKFWTLYDSVSGDLPLLTASKSWRQLFFDAKNNLGIDVVQVEKYDFVKTKVDSLKTYTQILSTEMGNLVKIENSSNKLMVDLEKTLNMISQMQQEASKDFSTLSTNDKLISYPLTLAALKEDIQFIQDRITNLHTIISNDGQILSNVQNLDDTRSNIETVIEAIGTDIQMESLDEYLPIQTPPAPHVLVNDQGKTNIA